MENTREIDRTNRAEFRDLVLPLRQHAAKSPRHMLTNKHFRWKEPKYVKLHKNNANANESRVYAGVATSAIGVVLGFRPFVPQHARCSINGDIALKGGNDFRVRVRCVVLCVCVCVCVFDDRC
jgi:hypothetical protein